MSYFLGSWFSHYVSGILFTHLMFLEDGVFPGLIAHVFGADNSNTEFDLPGLMSGYPFVFWTNMIVTVMMVESFF
jgi:hypothetical protein